MNGDRVNYTMGPQDADTLNKVWPFGGSVNGVRGGRLPVAGEVRPAWVTRENADGTKNLHVLLDASIGHWVRDVTQGAGEGQFQPVV